ncbi:MAG: SUMF1/EgtB/PvdO family nonheme iron enzyme [Gammaproteobacteria bacterium]|nr:SUMF1/EgtB/PvdO family nonheme iron enzyme [Gammaproteobacteria bacterium]
MHSDSYGHRYFAWDESLSAWVTVQEFLPAGLADRTSDGIAVLPALEEESAFHHGLQEFTELGEVLHEHPSTGLERVLRILRCNGTAYWLMEPMEGASLSAFLRHHTDPLSERELIRLAHHLLVALAALHREHVYHLSVTPEHIFLANVDHPCLGGVAMAQFKLALRQGRLETILNPAFSAPELGESSDTEMPGPQADLFGLGASLYFAMTRRLLALSEGMPAPHFSQNERVLYTTACLQIIGRLVSPDRKQRYASVLEVLQALARLTAQEGKKPATVVEHHYGPELVMAPTPGRWRWLSLGVMLSALVFGGGYWLNQQAATVGTASAPVEIETEPAARSEPKPARVDSPELSEAPAAPPKPPVQRVFQFSDPLADGGVGPEMVLLPTGEFLMGDARAVGQSSEVPVHSVSIGKRFAMSRFEVSFEDYDRYVAATGRTRPSDEGWGRGRRPVINVSYNDAQAYIEWLKQQTGKPYRLATESEWEYAARAGAKGLHSWGDKIGRGNAVCDGCGSEWDYSRTAPVGSFAPNAFGLYDMQGNVAEWVQDCWAADYGAAPTDGTAYLGGNCGFRVWRGGSWSDLPRALRLSARTSYPRDYRSNQAGFRVVVDL